MQPQANGGVVDTHLVVYGTSNLRVVDASIMPLQVRPIFVLDRLLSLATSTK